MITAHSLSGTLGEGLERPSGAQYLEKLLYALEGTLGDGAPVHLNVDLETADLDLLLVL